LEINQLFQKRFQEIKQENSLKTDETLQAIKELQNEKDYQANSFKVCIFILYA
jgi:hypothetical protein